MIVLTVKMVRFDGRADDGGPTPDLHDSAHEYIHKCTVHEKAWADRVAMRKYPHEVTTNTQTIKYNLRRGWPSQKCTHTHKALLDLVVMSFMTQ